MAGRITDEEKERVRDANRIEVVVGEYVSLKPSGGGNLKGLCPFHDEKTPSFSVRPAQGGYYCFGCGEGGDVFSFVAAMEHLSFLEALERLAERAGITLTRVEGGASTRSEPGTRSRLIAANKAAAEFYAEQLLTDEGAPGRDFLAERGFDLAAAQAFGCGYAPSGWDRLTKHLLSQGFSLQELYKAGLARQGQRGPIDQFHRRLLWTIRDAAGDVVGFGARRLFDDDRIEAKYVNTAETPLYKKSTVLYGLDLAKREIAKQRRAVIVEGYSDVMAMHLAGVTTAVASCGTAFGEEHISVLRRYLLDNDVIRGEVVYTFDGDAAGQKAALKAFDSDQRFAANTFVAVAPDGMDPCDLRLARGEAAVRALVDGRTHLFAFAIQTTLANYDLETPEGRVAATAATVPMVARIKEDRLRDDYARQLAGWVGTEPTDIQQLVRREAGRQRAAAGRDQQRGPVGEAGVQGQPGPARPNPRQASLSVEREVLKLALQNPDLVGADYALVQADCFSHPAYTAVHEAVLAAGGPAAHAPGPAWTESVAERVPAGVVRSLVRELAIEPPLHGKGDADAEYAGSIVAAMAERSVAREEESLRSALRRAESSGDRDRARDVQSDLAAVISYRRALMERARGGAA